MSDTSVKARLAADIKAAMKAGDKARLATLRNIHAAIKQREIDDRVELDDAAVIAVLDKRAKQHRESLEAYRSAGRDDLAAQEEAELAILGEFLPQALTEAEIEDHVRAAIRDTGASSVREMGQVMAVLKPQLQGRADMGAVSARVKAHLNASG